MDRLYARQVLSPHNPARVAFGSQHDAQERIEDTARSEVDRSDHTELVAHTIEVVAERNHRTSARYTEQGTDGVSDSQPPRHQPSHRR